MSGRVSADAIRDNTLDAAVDVWRAGLDVGRAAAAALSQHLSAEEHARADRFQFERDRARFVAGRGLLRRILGARLGVDPHDVRIVPGSHGKPQVCPSMGTAPLFFNVSHSGAYALFAVSAASELGIDLEVIRRVADRHAVARRCFSEAERQALDAVPAKDEDGAFFRCWTRKEAYVKAAGAGLSYPLGSFDVALEAGEPARILRAPDDARSWWMADLSAFPIYAAALVVKTAPAAVLVHDC